MDGESEAIVLVWLAQTKVNKIACIVDEEIVRSLNLSANW